MASDGALVKASTDKTIPRKFVGKIEPNYFCRGWNAKREKYCGARAGHGTTHKGVGRCFQHGGTVEDDARLSHGRYRSIESPRIQELLDELAQDPDPLNVLEDLQLARALLRDYIERSSGRAARLQEAKTLAAALDDLEARMQEAEEGAEQLQRVTDARDALEKLAAEKALPDIAEAVKMLDVVSKMIHRVEVLRTAGAVSLDQVRRFLGAVDRVLQHHVADEALRSTIRRDIYAIRV